MRTCEIEAWALRAIDRVEKHQPNEDSRVELKAVWPDGPEKAARQIAGHANALHGEPILWVIGVDEKQGVSGASQNDLANWWPQVKVQFDGPVPILQDVLVDWERQDRHRPLLRVRKNPLRGQEPDLRERGRRAG